MKTVGNLRVKNNGHG